MQPVPPEVWADFEWRLDDLRAPPPQRPDYRKWVRFYFDFCHKYGHSASAPTSRGPFLAKLSAKNQSVAQRSQASTQNQAFNALLFFYRQVLHRAFGQLDGVVRAKHHRYVPVGLIAGPQHPEPEALPDATSLLTLQALAVGSPYGCGGKAALAAGP